jgi:hypothetical protein
VGLFSPHHNTRRSRKALAVLSHEAPLNSSSRALADIGERLMPLHEFPATAGDTKYLGTVPPHGVLDTTIGHEVDCQDGRSAANLDPQTAYINQAPLRKVASLWQTKK